VYLGVGNVGGHYYRLGVVVGIPVNGFSQIAAIGQDWGKLAVFTPLSFFGALDHAIEESFGVVKYGEPNFELVEQLRGSAALFSAHKTEKQANDLVALLTKENGHVRSWKEFQEQAKPIVKAYNQTWLEAEYNTAVSASRSAENWQKYVENADLYPNLEYLPSRAANPDEVHRRFYGIRKPITDPFWLRFYPPSRWGCLCGVEPTDEDPTEGTPEGAEAAPGLDNNPGITGKLFSESHPYFQGLTGNEKQAIAEKAKEYVTGRTKKSGPAAK
jgi:hypothetical protein